MPHITPAAASQQRAAAIATCTALCFTSLPPPHLHDALQHVPGACVPADAAQLHQPRAEPPRQPLPHVLAQGAQGGGGGGRLPDHREQAPSHLDQEADACKGVVGRKDGG